MLCAYVTVYLKFINHDNDNEFIFLSFNVYIAL